MRSPTTAIVEAQDGIPVTDTVDGVMQGLGAADEHHSGGFERGVRAMPAVQQRGRGILSQVHQRAGTFLFGRRTYEIFAGSRAAAPGPSFNPSQKR